MNILKLNQKNQNTFLFGFQLEIHFDEAILSRQLHLKPPHSRNPRCRVSDVSFAERIDNAHRLLQAISPDIIQRKT